jgi:ParB family chromosome partitioning protein
MDPIEEAEAYRRYVQDYGWGGISDLAANIGKSVGHISRRITLLELPEDIIQRIRYREISPSIAEELLPLTDKKEQSELAALVSSRHLTMRKVRKIIQDKIVKDDNGNAELEINSLYKSRRQISRNKSEKAFDKAIVAAKLTLSNLGNVIEEMEGRDWIANEMLLQHKSIIHSQIDILLKQKRKYARF